MESAGKKVIRSGLILKPHEDIEMTTKKECPLTQLHGLPEPGPVVLVSASRAGRVNDMHKIGQRLPVATMMEDSKR